MKIYVIISNVLISSWLFSQVGINNAGQLPHPGAGLEVNFTDKGVLVPRVQLLKTDTLYPVVAGAEGLLVYNISDTNDVKPGFYYWSGGKWRRVLDEATVTAGAWILAGNTGTDSTHFLGTTDAKPLRIKTKDSLRMIIDTLGNVGIGVTQPGVRLDVGGAVRTETYTIRRVDLTNATSNYELAVGEEAVIKFNSATSVPLRISIPQTVSLSQPVIYEIIAVLHCAGNCDEFYLLPNGTNFTNQFSADIVTTPAPSGSCSSLTHLNGSGWWSNQFSFDVGCGTNESGVCYLRWKIFYAGAGNKKITTGMNGCSDYGFNISQSVWNNTTSSWDWLGIFKARYDNVISGNFLIKRLN